MKKVILKIEGMSCSACSVSLEKYLNKQKGINKATVNLVLAQVLIEYEESLSIADLEKFIDQAGFKSLGIYNAKEEKKQDYAKGKLIGFGGLAILTMYIAMGQMWGLPIPNFLNMMLHPEYYAFVLFILALIFLIYGFDIIKSGLKNLEHLTPNMDTLVTIGVLASFLYSTVNTILIWQGGHHGELNLYFESSIMIIYFLKLGRFIDNQNKEKTKEALKELVQITPQKALLKIGGDEKEVTIDEVKKGDILIAKPGVKIAVDGVIASGEAHLDEAFITGEAKPVKKGIGENVIAGSINYDGYIEYQAEKIGKDSTISEIVRLVVEATNTKPPIAKLADKVSNYFVPLIMLIAFITLIDYLCTGYILADALVAMITVLVVACPCALGLATPLAMVVSIGACAQRGILIKNNAILEQARNIDTFVFDKTGTLTYGDLKIAKIKNYSRLKPNNLIALAASLEQNSAHPISKAFTNYASEHHLELGKVKYFKNIAGVGLKGQIKNTSVYVGNNKLLTKLKIKNPYLADEEELAGEGNSIIYIVRDKTVLGLIGVKDVIRPQAKAAIKGLKKRDKEIIMLSGDNQKTAEIVAKALGITNVYAGVMPQEKTKIISDLCANGQKVIMVGDGINDAPSLARATIGVSINNATDIAADSADVILLNDDLRKLEDLITISAKTIRNIKQNLFWAFFYNILMVPIAMGVFKPWGLKISPMFAALAMMFSSFTVIFNVLRLKKEIENEKNN